MLKSAGFAVALIFGALGPVGIVPCESGAAIAQSIGYACCKVCKAGKACGDSCISANSNCTKGKGCACNG